MPKTKTPKQTKLLSQNYHRLSQKWMDLLQL